MAQPPLYSRNANFVEYGALHPGAEYNPADHDSELDDVATSLNAAIQNLGLIQRDDGQLANGGVGLDQIDPAVLALFDSEVTWRGAWVTLTVYAYGDIVEQTGTRYVCLVAHTAGTFATDLSAAKWQALGLTLPIPADQITNTPAGSIASTTVQAAINELASEKAALAGSAGQTFSMAAATLAAHGVNHQQLQAGFWNVATSVGGTGNAITATLASGGVTALANEQVVRVSVTSSNSTAAPTLNLTLDGPTATGAITIVRGDTGGPLAVGDIPLAEAWFRYRASPSNWILLNAVSAPSPAAGGTDDGKVVAAIGGKLQLVSSATVFTAASLPPGVIFMWPEATPPDWALELNGTTGLSRVTYAELFAVVAKPKTFTVSIASPGVFSCTAHRLKAGSKIRLTTDGALPTGLSAGTDYYVIAAGLTANAFQVSASAFGAAVNTSGSQSGTHTQLDHSVLGPGDGSSTFSVPDDRARFWRAWDDGAGVDASRVLGSTQVDDFKVHQHGLFASSTGVGGGTPLSYGDGGSTTHVTSATGGTETRPLNRAYLPCIAI